MISYGHIILHSSVTRISFHFVLGSSFTTSSGLYTGNNSLTNSSGFNSSQQVILKASLTSEKFFLMQQMIFLYKERSVYSIL